jgi:hypothetical protein
VAAAVIGTTLILGGCYGSTEPATDVGSETATLRAQGTANNGPAGSWFEYWVTGSTANPRTTESIHWPSGASGAFSQKVKNLADGPTFVAPSGISRAKCHKRPSPQARSGEGEGEGEEDRRSVLPT